MIRPGDHVLIGVSGGKDSMLLSYLLARRRDDLARRAAAYGKAPAGKGNAPLELLALRVVYGVAGRPGPRAPTEARLAELYASWGIPLIEYAIDSPPPAELGCYRCASLRREALMSFAASEGYELIALGHHLDDILTTALMNLVRRGMIEGMEPVRAYPRFGVKLVRPLCYIPEESIRRLAAERGWLSVSCGCPAGADGERAEFRRRLEALCPGGLAEKRRLFEGLIAIA
jgi:tRNA(Ile)-lysidine synthase TilS/MesJ